MHAHQLIIDFERLIDALRAVEEGKQLLLGRLIHLQAGGEVDVLLGHVLTRRALAVWSDAQRAQLGHDVIKAIDRDLDHNRGVEVRAFQRAVGTQD